jgi:hypothetical protein
VLQKDEATRKVTLLTRGIFAIASFSLVAFFVGLFEGILTTLVLCIMLVSLVRREEAESE